MPNEYSVYSVHEAQTPQWLPGEESAATAFIAMSYLLVVEVNIDIHRVFKRRQGAYFWAMQIGSIGCFLDATAMILRYLVLGAERIWVLYTLMPSVGWALYTVAELTVLYSRLHLVSQSRKTQRFVFWMIVIVSPLIIIADWITTWPAWDPDPSITNKWSPAQAIVERIAQLGFSIVEVLINTIYAISLLRLLKVKSSIRQRRVMWDLIYVVNLATMFDVLNIILVYVNRTGISHPIQTFSYILKLRLEFIVLNQLMAVAARGVGNTGNTFAEKRYNYPSSIGNSSFKGDSSFKESSGLGKSDFGSMDPHPSNGKTSNNSVQISMPSPSLLKSARSHTASTEDPQSQRSPSLGGGSKWDSPHIKSALHNLLPRRRDTRRNSDEHEMVPVTVKRKKNGLRRNDQDEPEEHTIGVHEWESNGQHVLQIPWFREGTVCV